MSCDAIGALGPQVRELTGLGAPSLTQ